MKDAYLILDLSSGAVRAYVMLPNGEKLVQRSRPIRNVRDLNYDDALSFDPELLAQDLFAVCSEAVAAAGDVHISAVSATSARESTVLLDAQGRALGGYPNIDNRGSAWEQTVKDRHDIYARSGRWVNTLFPAVKFLGLRAVYPELWQKTACFLSLSDYVGWLFTGQVGYEQSQAGETLLFDVQTAQWSDELCEVFGIPRSMLPNILKCGEVLGETIAEPSRSAGIPVGTPFIVGGADTQMAVAHCHPMPGEVSVVAGTTTPIAFLTETYLVDAAERCWVDRHIDGSRYLVETNVGVSGMNYDRAIKIFYPGWSYEQVEVELASKKPGKCLCTAGSMIFHKGQLTPKGGFFLDAPLQEDMDRGDFLLAVLLDYAFSFKTNLEQLFDIVHQECAVLHGCGGGFSGKILPQLLADISGCEIRIPQNFASASCSGLVDQLNLHFKRTSTRPKDDRVIMPRPAEELLSHYERWQACRQLLHG